MRLLLTAVLVWVVVSVVVAAALGRLFLWARPWSARTGRRGITLRPGRLTMPDWWI